LQHQPTFLRVIVDGYTIINRASIVFYPEHQPGIHLIVFNEFGTAGYVDFFSPTLDVVGGVVVYVF
jgi:hypothetical protein